MTGRLSGQHLAGERRAGVAGFTILELMIALSVVLLVTGGVSQVMQTASGSFKESARSADLQARSSRVLSRLVRELSVTGDGETSLTAQLPAGEAVTELEYQPSLGRDGGVELWGERRRIELVLGAGEQANGLDDNGNGLVDERDLFLIERSGELDEVSVLLSRGIAELAEGELPNGQDDNGNGLIDEPGFSIVRDGETLTLRLTVERSLEGRVARRTTTRVLRLKN